MEVLRYAGRDELCRFLPELRTKQTEKVWLGDENDAVHALRQSTLFEKPGEVVREVHRGALVP
jgi:hypothetical protein